MKQNKDDFKIQLHVHPYFTSYSLNDIINAAKKKKIDILALERLNKEIFPDLINRSKKLPPHYKTDSDNTLIQILDKEDGRKIYLPKAIELETKEDFHLIIIGDSQIKPYSYIEDIIENALKNDSLVIFDHPFADNKYVAKDITREKEAGVEKICKKYSNNICLEWNAYCIPWVRELIGGSDVNKKVERLSASLVKQGYNIPIVTDSDIHARYRWSLNEIDKASIKTKKVNVNSGKTMISDLKESINSGNYEINMKYVSFTHLMLNFCLPLSINKICKKLYKKPRA